jgi:hypothetical protein
MLFITSIGDALRLPHSLMNAPGEVVWCASVQVLCKSRLWMKHLV